MTSLKDIRSIVQEVLSPKSPDEKRFKDKHIVVKTPDANGNGDDVFQATNIKPAREKEKEDRHGHKQGDDEKVYEDAYADEEIIEGSERNLEAIRTVAQKSKLNQLLKTRKDSRARAAIKYAKLSKEYEKHDKENDDEDEDDDNNNHMKESWLNEKSPDTALNAKTTISKAISAVAKRATPATATTVKNADTVTEDVFTVTEGKSFKNMSDKELRQRHTEIDKKIADVGGVSANHRFAQQKRLIRVILAGRKAGGMSKNNVKEENTSNMETIMEKKTLSSLLDKAEAAHKAGDMDAVKQHLKNIKRYSMTAKVKEMGSPDLTTRYKKLKSAVSEEIQTVNELSKKTLGNYISQASYDKSSLAHDIGRINQKAATSGTTKADRAERDELNKKHGKRSGGIQLAVSKLVRKEEVEQVDEVLKPSMGVKAYIDDFVKSDDPRFKGASKKERIKRAIAAFYSAKGMKRDMKEAAETDALVDNSMVLEAKESREAVARYHHYHGQIKDSLKNLATALDNHKRNAKENNIHWGHVGDIKNIHRMLQDMHDQLTQTNDYSIR